MVASTCSAVTFWNMTIDGKSKIAKINASKMELLKDTRSKSEIPQSKFHLKAYIRSIDEDTTLIKTAK